MNTTTVLVEHVLSGIQALIWFTLLTLSLFGFAWLNLSAIKGFEAALTFIFLAIIYPLGVFMDNLSDKILESRGQKLKRKHILNDKMNVGYVLDKASGPVSTYFTYTRMRIRVSRVTFLNFLLITVAAVVFTLTRLPEVLKNSLMLVAFWEIVTGLTLSYFAFWNWKQITNNYYEKAAIEIEKHRIDKF